MLRAAVALAHDRHRPSAWHCQPALGSNCCSVRRTHSYVRSCARCVCDPGPSHSPSSPLDYPRDCFSFLRGALNPRAEAATVYVLDDDGDDLAILLSNGTPIPPIARILCRARLPCTGASVSEPPLSCSAPLPARLFPGPLLAHLDPGRPCRCSQLSPRAPAASALVSPSTCFS